MIHAEFRERRGTSLGAASIITLHTYYWIDFFSLNTCKKGWECTCKQHDDGTGM